MTTTKPDLALGWPFDNIINAAICLRDTGTTTASTSEHIAAAFVLNRMDLLPDGYRDVVEAWDRLDDWQDAVRLIKRRYVSDVGLC